MEMIHGAASYGKDLFHQGFKFRPAADRIVLDFLQHFCDGLYEQIRVHDVRGMAFGVLGFPLVVLAAIGNVPLAADKQTKNKAHNLGGFLVNYPKILVIRAFHIAVGGFGGNRHSAHAFLS